MTAEPENITLILLREIRAELQEIRSEMKADFVEVRAQLGTLGQGQLSMRNELRTQGQHMNEIAIAVDAHTDRLERIDKHLGHDKSKH